MNSIFVRIAQEIGAQPHQVEASVEMLDGGATVPFIARYRKEATGELDDQQLRVLEERLRYLRELDDRKVTILKSIDEQGKLTDDLKALIDGAETKSRVEDLYLPYKPKRRTKAQIAREAGLEPLADALFADPTLDPKAQAEMYLRPDTGDDTAIATTEAALEGARQILAERFSENAELLAALRSKMWNEANLVSKVNEGKEKEGEKFRDYFDYTESVSKVPSHRALAIFRGRKEEILRASLVIGDPDDQPRPHPCEFIIRTQFGISDQGRAADTWLLDVARWTWAIKLSMTIEIELMGQLWDASEEEAIRVFANNLRDLLLAAPAGARPTIALDPGYRSGVKVAVIDATGKLVDKDTIYPHVPQNQWDKSIASLANLIKKHGSELVSIGNGTASRETDKLAAELIQKHADLNVTKVMVSEAGASVYSASVYAAKEFPDVDVTIRGAASIGRRLQDPLAELVKIDPKAIGVGQYQHDLSEFKLGRMLGSVVEDCVNAVGVDLNTASAPLLARVSGVGETLAENIVEHRNVNGAFQARADLKKVPRLGDKAFEQCAGFLKIMDGDNPLDRSSVHPESYPLVERILKASNKDIRVLIGDKDTLSNLNEEDFVDDTFGAITVHDIFNELEKPGRDPRPEFKTATFKDGIEEIKDLKEGMVLEGTVTNVANFGAFVDVGVHQDGLVHISQLANRFVKDPREVVKPGDVVKVRVQEFDATRKRISLTMRLDQPAESPSPKPQAKEKKQASAPQKPAQSKPKKQEEASDSTAFADAFAKAKKK